MDEYCSGHFTPCKMVGCAGENAFCPDKTDKRVPVCLFIRFTPCGMDFPRLVYLFYRVGINLYTSQAAIRNAPVP